MEKCQVCDKQVKQGEGVRIVTDGKLGLTVMHQPCFDGVWQKHTDGLKVEDIDGITNEIMDTVRREFDICDDSDQDDVLYSEFHDMLSDKLELFIV